MAERKRTEAQRAADLVEIERLHLRGKTEVEIAEKISAQRPYALSRQQVGYDLRTLAAMWKKEALAERDDNIAKELASIRSLQKEYYEAWERTLDERTKTRTEQSTPTGQVDKDGKAVKSKVGTAKATVEKETLLGNPAYLAGVQWCISERSKILGLYAPNKIAPTSPDGKEPYLSFTADDAAKAKQKLDEWKKARQQKSEQNG